jgi:hypothetical protein
MLPPWFGEDCFGMLAPEMAAVGHIAGRNSKPQASLRTPKGAPLEFGRLLRLRRGKLNGIVNLFAPRDIFGHPQPME